MCLILTEPLSINYDEMVIESAMNSLPVFGNGESVTVVRNSIATADASFTFFFESRRGKFVLVFVCLTQDTMYKNILSDVCAQRRLKIVCTYAQSDGVFDVKMKKNCILCYLKCIH